MSRSFLDGSESSGNAPPEKLKFSQTCNLLSQYLKGKGSIRDLNFETEKLGTRHEESINLFSQHAPALTTLQDAINTNSSEKQASTDPMTAQMTIFYAGQVLVVDNLPAANAKEVMQLASKYNNVNKAADNCCSNSKPSASTSIQAKEKQTQTQPLDSDLPIARRASLHRFLEKRRDRATARAPYQFNNPSGESSKQTFDLNMADADSTSETRDTFSDSFSDESESEKLSRWDGCSSEEWVFEQENLWHQNDRLGHLYCQYFEKSTPYGRVPLMDKINALSQKYPGLMSLRSVDLSPASWMAVSWYPIYHIPMGRTIKDLSTCFLTYHTLSSSFQDLDVDDEMVNTNSKWKKSEGIALPPFGLATYKMQGDVWVSNKNGGDHERLNSLLSVADSWLKQLRVQHHDFNYFTGIRRG